MDQEGIIQPVDTDGNKKDRPIQENEGWKIVLNSDGKYERRWVQI